MKTVWVMYFVALGLCACAANSDQNKSAATPLVTADCANADSAIASACKRLVADAQGEQNQRPMAILIDKSMFATGTLDGIKHSTPSGFAETLLRDEAINDPNVSRAVKEFGLPDAVEIDATQAFAMYYRSATRTFIFHQGQAVTLTDITRSVRILAFKEQPTATPWPTTLTGETANWLGVSESPAAPPDKLDSTDFAEDETYLRVKIAPSADAVAKSRASSMLAKLAPSASITGIDWQVVVFQSSAPDAFAVPDGTLFISDRLIGSANDHELAAVIAHLMGHVRYGHYRAPRSGWSSMSTAQKAGTITFFAVAAPVVIGACLVAYPVCAAVSANERQHPSSSANTTPAVDQRREEIEANQAAVSCLAAQGIKPSELFAAMIKFELASSSDWIPPRENSNLDYSSMQDHADNGAADLGRMLDAGMIPGQ